MKKRIFSLLACVVVIVCMFSGCVSEKSKSDVKKEPTIEITDGLTTSRTSIQTSKESFENTVTTMDDITDSSTTANSQSTVTEYGKTSSSVNKIDSSDNTSVTTTGRPTKKPGITTHKTNSDNTIKDIEDFFSTTTTKKDGLDKEYLYPSRKVTDFKVNSSGIYENMYVKLDTTKATKGYLLVTYKEKYADSLEIILEERATHADLYIGAYYHNFKKDEFGPNKTITIELPKTDAIYYISIWSTIEQADACKLCISLGQITKEGEPSYQYMVPSTEEQKLVEISKGIYSNKYVRINTNTISKGYIEVEYVDNHGYDVRIEILTDKINHEGRQGSLYCKGNKKGKQTIKAPLTYGDGTYQLTVESTITNASTGVGRISDKAQIEFVAKNVSNTGPFSYSVGEVIYNSDMKFIKKAEELAKNCKNDFEKVDRIYNWLTDFLKYEITDDYTAVGLYQCDLERIYNRGTGVCYDYAVILAAMLRSQGIACKVIFGDVLSPGSGHAWNEVYISQDGYLDGERIYISGKKWCILDPTRSTEGPYEYDKEFMKNPDNYYWEDIY